jgi:DNA-binding NarL/FixJ family response regulator
MGHLRAYLAGNRGVFVPLLTAALDLLGYTHPRITDGIGITDVGRAAPDLLVLDLDAVETNPIELLRMTRFVLPTCMIAVYSSTLQLSWAHACHLAGANCILSKSSDVTQIAAGLRQGITKGCFTDPSFVAA